MESREETTPQEPVPSDGQEQGTPPAATKPSSAARLKKPLLLGCLFIAIVVCVCTGVLGTVLWKGYSAASPAAEAVLEAHRDGDFEGMYERADPTMKENMTRETFLAIGRTVDSTMGGLREWRPAGMQMHRFGSDAYVDLTYRATFEKHEGMVRMRLRKSDLSSRGYSLAGYRVESPAFLATNVCPSCGHANMGEAQYCSNCGASLTP